MRSRLSSAALRAAVVCLVFFSSCLTAERTEIRIRYDEKDVPIEVTIRYSGISSDEEKEVDLAKDFQRMLDSWLGDAQLVDWAKKGFAVRERKVFLEGGKLQGREVLVPVENDLSDWFDEKLIVSNGERILVLDKDDGRIVDTNGKVVESEKNLFVVWPESAREIYFVQDYRSSWRPDAAKVIDRNAAELAKRFEAHLQKNPVTR